MDQRRPGAGGSSSTTATAIADYALLSDRHSAALVSTSGSVDWLCMPRFDSPSTFGALLGEDAGHWSIRPVGGFRVEREYVAASLVLRTTFVTAQGVLELRDALSLGRTDDPHRLGEHAPHVLLRSVACTEGSVAVEVRFRPRPEYGLIAPALHAVDGGLVASGGAARLTVSSTVPLEIGRDDAHARFELRSGELACFALRQGPLGAPSPPVMSGPAIAGAIEETVDGWGRWSAQHQHYQGRWRELVHHSGRVLQAMSYQPTGAIVAAATTSLPEEIGGERNWDYRYSWVRDASLAMQALWVAACPDEADEFFGFMAAAAASADVDGPLQIMFGIGGEHDLSERTLTHLPGWRGSSPVRVGNGAWNQSQLDVYGELLDSAHQLRDQLGHADGPTRDFLVRLADAAAARWEEPDNGIWEVRGEARHFVHSKVMCWVALDRAVALADWLGAGEHVERWASTAERIRTAVLTDGWDERMGAFTQSFGRPDLDATALLLPIVGFLPADDPRMLSTIDAVRDGLTDGRGLVRRYRTETGVDGLAGEEGTFLLCTFWLAHALALAGRTEEGSQVFERAIGYRNDVDLLAEEVDSATGESLGNFPQAFSHIGLVNAAWALEQPATAGGAEE
ncbi:MAG TPA: glycoside hydrolase family 15 protein [Intrasporangium sp.]|uniref:glycoside hydrolase family 15 protein n=1 Tax=Intrasporangium sp. TaxID=1925024 RepID=UPI002D79389D|nr:glycoside hydrolase family 15 protein [Intrasporangium sp.]HET7398165.1 glycoside hydrolase family 15 protein [Intrasporangium sp.]